MEEETLPDKLVTAHLGNQVQTEWWAQQIALVSMPGDILALTGPMGAGKTVFARAFINALAEERGVNKFLVTSPTYNLVQIYELPEIEIYHVDLYRLEDGEDLRELGLEEAYDHGISLIEWPDRMRNFIPNGCLYVKLEQGHGSTERTVSFLGQSNWLDRLQSIKHGN